MTLVDLKDKIVKTRRHLEQKFPRVVGDTGG